MPSPSGALQARVSTFDPQVKSDFRTVLAWREMATVAFDVAAVRRRFSALQRELAFFDGPGGTQTPDEVIDAIATYLREANANVGGPFETSRRSEALIAGARLAAGELLGAGADEVVFGANMTTLNFALSRACP